MVMAFLREFAGGKACVPIEVYLLFLIQGAFNDAFSAECHDVNLSHEF